jgi:hypothetical protein
MPDPNLAEDLARGIVAIYADAESSILSTVANRIADGLPDLADAIRPWEARKLSEIRALRAQLEFQIGILDEAAFQAVQDELAEAFAFGRFEALDELGELAEFVRAVPVEALVPVDRAVQQLATEMQGQMRANHLAILRQVPDAYRRIISETIGRAVATAVAPRIAAQSALNRFADQGIGLFTDRTGRRWNLISYTEMATRTAAGRAQIEGTLDAYGAAGLDLVMVTDHPAECDLCRPFEGAVFRRSGGARGDYPTLDSARAQGLFHANCRHSVVAFIPDVTRIPKKTEDARGYELRMQQRHLERQIRKWRKRESVSIGDFERRIAGSKVREWQAEMRSFIDESGLQRLRYREQIKRAR